MLERPTREKIEHLYHQPILELVYQAATVHRANFDPQEVQVSSLVSIKTGACPEDCSYCPQSARYHTDIDIHRLMATEEVLAQAKAAKANGASRLCMGAAWRQVKDNKDFERVLDMVSQVNGEGLEVCATLGMLTPEQALRLSDAGLKAYNHNLDTSREYYADIITTRTYDDRLETIENVQRAGISVCSGGIIGLGESDEDRISMLYTLSQLSTPPESVPINALVPVENTPLENQPKVSIWDMLRMIATTRIVLPHSMVRLSAGRTEMSDVEQAFCFLAGANSIFAGDKLLTTPNPAFSSDQALFDLLGLRPKAGEPVQPAQTAASCC